MPRPVSRAGLTSLQFNYNFVARTHDVREFKFKSVELGFQGLDVGRKACIAGVVNQQYFRFRDNDSLDQPLLVIVCR